MQLRIVTVPLRSGVDPTGTRTALDELQTQHEITRYDHYLVDLSEGPAIAIVAAVRPREPELEASGSRRRNRRSKLEDTLAGLDSAQRQRFERLRAWRRLVAEEAGLPVFTVATNRQLAEMLRLEKPSRAKLRQITGFGSRRVERYGDALLELLLDRTGGAEKQKGVATPEPTKNGGGQKHD